MEGDDGSDGIAIGPPSSDSGPVTVSRSLWNSVVAYNSSSKQNLTYPSRNALCVKLVGNDHVAAHLLISVVHWAKYGNAEIPGVHGKWVANSRDWWMRECCLSPSQYDRSIAKLKKRSLVETRQWWFGRRNILHVRPTKIALDYVASATTWLAAAQFMPDPYFAEIDDPTLGNLVISNVDGEDEKLGSSKTVISNNISNLHKNQTSKPKCAAPASPSCAGENDQSNFGKTLKKSIDASTVDLKKLELIWIASSSLSAITKFHNELPAKERGALARVESYFAAATKKKLQVAEGKEQQAVELFLNWTLENWLSVDAYSQPHQPDLFFLSDEFPTFFDAWISSKFGSEHCTD